MNNAFIIGSHLTPPPESIVGSTGTLTGPVPSSSMTSRRIKAEKESALSRG